MEPKSLNRDPILPPVLSAKLSARADRLVREIVSGYPLIDPRGWSDLDVAKLRVLVGVAMHDGAALGMIQAYASVAGRVAPPATTKIDPQFDADATTRKMKR